MTEPEQQEIDAWFAAVQKAQPPGTLAALVYVRDGTVNLDRGDVPLEIKEFPADDLEVAGELITAAVEDAGPK